MRDFPGRISPIRTDQIDPWRLIQYNPLYWSRSLVEANQEGWLRLRP